MPEICAASARRARPRDDGRRHEVPRPVRGAHQGGDDRGAPRQGRHPLHRRAAHAGRRRRRRGRDRRVQRAQAGLVARRGAVHRRDDARRVPQVHREGRRARASLPDRQRRAAVARSRPSRSSRACATATKPTTGWSSRRGARGRRRAVEPLHQRPLPAGQGDRRDRRGRCARAPPLDDPAAGPAGHGPTRSSA